MAAANLPALCAYARAVAKDPCGAFSEAAPERQALIALRDRVLQGQSRRYKRTTASASKQEDRPCSPTFFERHEEEPMDLDRVAKRYYIAPDASRPVSAPGHNNGLLPAFRHTTLGATLLPIRRVTPWEKWSAREIAIFESGLCQYGKQFDIIAKLLGAKGTQDVVEFYYYWKKASPHHAVWKRSFKATEFHA